MRSCSYVSITVLAGIVSLFFVPLFVQAQELINTYQGTWHGEVIAVTSEETRVIPGTETEHTYQTIRARVLSGPQEGEEITIENDYLTLDTGDRFFFNHSVFDGEDSYGVVSIDRTNALYVMVLLFIAAVVAFGGWQGVRSLLALLASFLTIFFVLMPGILSGWSPLVASVIVASGILFAAIFFTHGFNRESAVAYGGTMAAVFLTGVLAIFAVHFNDLSGFTDESSVYLNLNTDGALNFTALLLGAIIIGVLGVLDDIAVTQAAVVTELFSSNPNLSRREVYRKALRVGREHVGALVNTLVLAYTGASLPLLLHFYSAASSFTMSVNNELFATEIVRTIVGSIGLIMTVPIVTGLAVWYLKDYTPKHAHSHSHSHGHTHHH